MKSLSKAGRHILPVLGGKITGGVIVGALIALTGFGPEHWFAEGFKQLGLPDLIARARGGGLDPRLGLVALGVGIVAADVLWRRRSWIEKAPLVAASLATMDNAVAKLPASLPTTAGAKRADTPPLSLVVLPFDNRSDQTGQDYFVDGLTEDITTEMSQLAGAFVISRNTAFTFRGKTAQEVANELRVKYVLSGSVKKSAESLRVTVELIDGATAASVWTRKFEYEVAEILELQERIAIEVASILNVELIEIESRASAKRIHPEIVDLVMLGKAAYNRGILKENMIESLMRYEAALAIDEANIDSLVGASRALVMIASNQWAHDPVAALNRAVNLSRKATEEAPNNAVAQHSLAAALRQKGLLDDAVAHAESAVRLDPNLLSAHMGLGLAYLFVEEIEKARPHFLKAIVLSPRDQSLFLARFGMGMANYAEAKYPDAVTELKISVGINPKFLWHRLYLIATYVAMSDMTNAAREMDRYLTDPSRPRTVAEIARALETNTGSTNSVNARMLSDLRLAGFPEN